MSFSGETPDTGSEGMYVYDVERGLGGAPEGVGGRMREDDGEITCEAR